MKVFSITVLILFVCLKLLWPQISSFSLGKEGTHKYST
jgi:hypothetical protein